QGGTPGEPAGVGVRKAHPRNAPRREFEKRLVERIPRQHRSSVRARVILLVLPAYIRARRPADQVAGVDAAFALQLCGIGVHDVRPASTWSTVFMAGSRLLRKELPAAVLELVKEAN